MDLQHSENSKIFMKKIGNAIVGGKNKITNFMQYENISIDLDWISQIENYIFSIEKVVKKPKKFIKEEFVVVPVERANRVDANTIRHLATHTGNIRDIDSNGFVTPSKVLTTLFDEDMAIYENRFVFTLINNLASFVENRYKIISQNSSSKTHNFKHSSNFSFGTTKVEYSLNMKIANPVANSFNKGDSEVIDKIKTIRKRISILKLSEFYQQLSKTKPLFPPIIKTNILNLEIDYNNCYKLWLYLATYTKVGYSIDISDKVLKFNEKYIDDLTLIVGYSVLAVLKNGKDDTLHIAENLVPKRFEVERQISYVNSTSVEKATDATKGVVNEEFSQYYYDAIKKVISETDINDSEQKAIERKPLDMPFADFYAKLRNVNERLFEEVLEIKPKDTEFDCDNVIDKKNMEISFITSETKKYDEILKQKQLDTKLTQAIIKSYKGKQKRLKEALVKLKLKQKEKAQKEKEQLKLMQAKEKSKAMADAKNTTQKVKKPRSKTAGSATAKKKVASKKKPTKKQSTKKARPNAKTKPVEQEVKHEEV